MSYYFPKPFNSHFGDCIKVKIDLSNYATKADIKNISHVHTSSFTLKTILANLKTEVDKLDIDRLVSVPTDLSKLSNVVKNDVVKKNDYDELVTKVNAIDTIRFVLKTKYDTDKSELENKIPDTSGLVKKANYNTKITEIEGKIPDISNLATKTALITVENKIPNISRLPTKTELNTVENKIPDISNLATKTALTTVENKIPDISSLVKKSDYNTKITEVENNIKKLQTYGLSYFRGKKYFDEEDGEQNYLVFLPKRRYFKLNSVINVIDRVLSWQSKEICNESIKPPTTSDNSLNRELSYYGTKATVKFTECCLKQPHFKFTHKKIVNIYIVYELGASTSNIDDATIKNCLFGAVALTKNADIDKYRYSVYGIGFDRRGSFLFPGGGFAQNVIIFGADMNSSIHIDNKGKDILILGFGPTQGLGEHSLTAEKMYSINFTVTKKKFCLSLHYNGANSYLFVNGTEIYKFKAKDSKIVSSSLCLGNISKDWSVDNTKRTRFTGYVYDFSVDCNAIAVDNIKDIHMYLMEKNGIV